jgi:hypothetical protein
MSPPCQIVLALLDGGPRRPHNLARTLGGDYPAARTALLLTGSGRRELRLQRSLWTRVALHHLAEPM